MVTPQGYTEHFFGAFVCSFGPRNWRLVLWNHQASAKVTRERFRCVDQSWRSEWQPSWSTKLHRVRAYNGSRTAVVPVSFILLCFFGRPIWLVMFAETFESSVVVWLANLKLMCHHVINLCYNHCDFLGFWVGSWFMIFMMVHKHKPHKL